MWTSAMDSFWVLIGANIKLSRAHRVQKPSTTIQTGEVPVQKPSEAMQKTSNPVQHWLRGVQNQPMGHFAIIHDHVRVFRLIHGPVP